MEANENQQGVVRCIGKPSDEVKVYLEEKSDLFLKENMTDRVKFMPNAAYCTLTYENGVLIPERYGISDHLPETSVHPI